MKPIEQQVYLPVDKQSDITDAIVTNNGENFHTFCLEQKGYFFTKEQLNEYTKNVIEQALETASENCRLSKDGSNTPYGEHFSDKCGTWTVNKQSIINTFEEMFSKFKV